MNRPVDDPVGDQLLLAAGTTPVVGAGERTGLSGTAREESRMGIPGSDAVVLGRITTSVARWADESPDNVRESLRGIINAQAQNRGLAALIVRMHPDTWHMIHYWLITGDVPVVCNVEHDPKSITLSTKSLGTDIACRVL